MQVTLRFSKWRLVLLCALSAACVSACSTPEVTRENGIYDPYEVQNRRLHESSKRVDTAVFRPVSVFYSNNVPDEIEDVVNNMANNLDVPLSMLNQLLQGDLPSVVHNAARFSINTTLGLAGVADLAGDLGLEERDADFGQTLAVWGVPQGAYLHVPLLGPRTQRDAFGWVVDFVVNPLAGFLSPFPSLPSPYDVAASGVRVAQIASDRGRFTDTIDSVLYESADSYVVTREIYYQNRAFELEKAGVVDENAPDPYADIFGE